jgi:hypothetical protein
METPQYYKRQVKMGITATSLGLTGVFYFQQQQQQQVLMVPPSSK